MTSLEELYQEVVLDHSRWPRNKKVPDRTNCSAGGHNPLCGDEVVVHIVFENGIVQDAGFEGSGCAISTASASLMTDLIRGKTRAEVQDLFERFHALVTGSADPAAVAQQLGDSAALGGVAQYPIRVKCATLAWHALQAALCKEIKKVSTE